MVLMVVHIIFWMSRLDSSFDHMSFVYKVLVLAEQSFPCDFVRRIAHTSTPMTLYKSGSVSALCQHRIEHPAFNEYKETKYMVTNHG